MWSSTGHPTAAESSSVPTAQGLATVTAATSPSASRADLKNLYQSSMADSQPTHPTGRNYASHPLIASSVPGKVQRGRATELWSYDLSNGSSRQITSWAGSDQWPVWYGENIFYASDRSTRLNIWRYNTSTGENVQITHHAVFDVMWPSGSNGRLVYENGGYLYVMNLSTGKSEKK